MVELPKLKINHLCQRVLSFPIFVNAKTGDTIRDQKRLDEIIRRCTAFEEGGLVNELRTACEMANEIDSVDNGALYQEWKKKLLVKLEAALAKS